MSTQTAPPKNFRLHQYLQGGLRPLLKPRPVTTPQFFPVLRRANVVRGRINININGVIMWYRIAKGTTGLATMPESGTVMLVIRRGRWHSAEVFTLPDECANTWAFAGTAVADVEEDETQTALAR